MNRKPPARTPGWTGLNLGSLPHESSLGALWRFAWFNALSGNEILRLAHISPSTAPLYFFGPRLHNDQFRRLAVATGVSFLVRMRRGRLRVAAVWRAHCANVSGYALFALKRTTTHSGSNCRSWAFARSITSY